MQVVSRSFSALLGLLFLVHFWSVFLVRYVYTSFRVNNFGFFWYKKAFWSLLNIFSQFIYQAMLHSLFYYFENEIIFVIFFKILSLFLFQPVSYWVPSTFTAECGLFRNFCLILGLFKPSTHLLSYLWNEFSGWPKQRPYQKRRKSWREWKQNFHQGVGSKRISFFDEWEGKALPSWSWEKYPVLSASLDVITFPLTDCRIFRDVFDVLCKTLCSVAVSSKEFLLELEFRVCKVMARRQY